MTVWAETRDERERRQMAAVKSDLDGKGIMEERQCKKVAVLFRFE